MAEQDLKAFILPMADEFLSEYVPPHAMRLTWLSGFDGSAGTIVVTKDRAALFTDGRYIIQAHDQLDTTLFDVINISQLKLNDWLKEEIGEQVVGYDSMLHSYEWVRHAKQGGLNLKAVQNPIDRWWEGRPTPPQHPAWAYPLEYAGVSSTEKRSAIAFEVKNKGADALLVSAAENIAWLLNIRGGDLECTPVLNAYALLYIDGRVQLFTDVAKVPDALMDTLDRVEVKPTDKLGVALAALARKTLYCDGRVSPAALLEQAKAANVKLMVQSDPIEKVKAIKNATELQHMRAVHVRDGAALVKSFAQIDTWLAAGEAVDELKVDALLASHRAAIEGFVSLSFPAIVGSGAHGAIVHYRVTEESNRAIASGDLLLIDSGGQYMGGTTDVTRTLAIGTPSPEQKKHYTLVLKGHLALARASFPKATPGSQLDVLARQFLWAEELDYDHGTGHGVGACLNVHEGPQGISKRQNTVALQPGMILSNEPGYYPEGKYGIRIENLVEVVEKDNGFYGFKNLTLVPYARALIDTSLLTAEEVSDINRYHKQVNSKLAEHLEVSEQAWLEKACAPL